MEISWINRVRNEEVLQQRAKEERNIVQAIKRRKADWIGHILHRNFLLNLVIKGRVEGTGRQGIRCKQLLDDCKEKRGYCKLKEKALNCTLWRPRYGRRYGAVVRQ
jgi:hypothetical protein